MDAADVLLLVLVIALLVSYALRHLRRPRRMSVEIKEKPSMAASTQTASFHPNKIEDIAGSAVAADGNPVALKNLAFTSATTPSPVGVPGADAVPTDANDTLDTKGVSVGATDTLTFTADGPDGTKYEAIVACTIVAPEVVIQPLTLTFTEVDEAA